MNLIEAHEQHEEAESSDTYSKKTLFDKKKYQKIMAKNMKIGAHEGFRKTFLDMFKRKIIQYFGTSTEEQPIPGEITAGQIKLP